MLPIVDIRLPSIIIYPIMMKMSNKNSGRSFDRYGSKVLALAPSDEYKILAVALFNSSSESFVEALKERHINDNKYRQKKTFVEDCRTLEYVRGSSNFRIYESSDYTYYKGHQNPEKIATLPDDWQNYGYTTSKQDGRGVSSETKNGLPEGVIKYQYKAYAVETDTELLAQHLEGSAE